MISSDGRSVDRDGRRARRDPLLAQLLAPNFAGIVAKLPADEFEAPRQLVSDQAIPKEGYKHVLIELALPTIGRLDDGMRRSAEVFVR